jgi:hypothetical protein
MSHVTKQSHANKELMENFSTAWVTHSDPPSTTWVKQRATFVLAQKVWIDTTLFDRGDKSSIIRDVELGQNPTTLFLI